MKIVTRTATAGWVFDPEVRHVCIIPTNQDLQGHFENALWRCGDCGSYWEVYWDNDKRKKDVRPVETTIAEKRMSEAQ